MQSPASPVTPQPFGTPNQAPIAFGIPFQQNEQGAVSPWLLQPQQQQQQLQLQLQPPPPMPIFPQPHHQSSDPRAGGSSYRQLNFDEDPQV